MSALSNTCVLQTLGQFFEPLYDQLYTHFEFDVCSVYIQKKKKQLKTHAFQVECIYIQRRKGEKMA